MLETKFYTQWVQFATLCGVEEEDNMSVQVV
jgi:hypothetical protein